MWAGVPRPLLYRNEAGASEIFLLGVIARNFLLVVTKQSGLPHLAFC